jgi:hypothetical protein
MTGRHGRRGPRPVAGYDAGGMTDDYVVIVLDGGYGIGEVHGPYSGFGATVVADGLRRRLTARGRDDLEVRVARLHR